MLEVGLVATSLFDSRGEMESTKEARRVNIDLNKEELECFRDEL